jgi:hypothetical protein
VTLFTLERDGMVAAAILAVSLWASEPGGLLYAMWQAADQAVLGQAVEVLPWAAAVALLPPEPLQA